MNTRLFLPLFFFLGTISALAERAEFACYSGDKTYTFKITSEQQSTCPKWNMDQQDHPPLSAAKAFRKAKAFIATVKPLEGHAWELQEIALVDVFGWLWRVRFQLTFSGSWSGPPRYMDSYVLMDGTLIKPVITASGR